MVANVASRARIARLIEDDLLRRRICYGGVPRIDVATWIPGVCYMTTRFWPNEIIELHHLLSFPQFITLDNGCIETGLTALAMLLARLAVPSRHFDLASIFGRERSIIGRIVRYAQEWIKSNWCHLLKWNPRRLHPARLEGYANSLVVEKKCPMNNCVGYIDGTVWKISRPKHMQQVFYNGHKRCHALKFQAVTTPDGLTVDLSEAYVGSRHDQAMLQHTQIEGILRQHAKGLDGRQMRLYGDKGYTATDVIMTPFRGHEDRLDFRQTVFNKAMSRCRIGVEHEFGRVHNVFRLTQYEDNLLFFKNKLNEIYHVAVFLKNCMICVGRGPGNSPLPPPSLAQYLGRI